MLSIFASNIVISCAPVAMPLANNMIMVYNFPCLRQVLYCSNVESVINADYNFISKKQDVITCVRDMSAPFTEYYHPEMAILEREWKNDTTFIFLDRSRTWQSIEIYM